MKRTVTTVLSAGEVARILAHHALAQRQIELVPGSHVEAEMLAVFEKDPVTKEVGITQYRVEATVDELREEWRGEG